MKQPRKRSNIGLSNELATGVSDPHAGRGVRQSGEDTGVLLLESGAGLIEIIRGIATMPEETRAAIEAFIALEGNTKAIKGELRRTHARIHRSCAHRCDCPIRGGR